MTGGAREAKEPVRLENSMSTSSKTKTIRHNKAKKQGKARKKQLAKQGTTPSFPVHREKA